MNTLSNKFLLDLGYSLSRFYKHLSLVLYLLAGKACIETLLGWANRKRIRLIAYERRLSSIVALLDVYERGYPNVLECAYWIRTFQTLLFPPPKVYPKGYARQFLG